MPSRMFLSAILLDEYFFHHQFSSLDSAIEIAHHQSLQVNVMLSTFHQSIVLVMSTNHSNFLTKEWWVLWRQLFFKLLTFECIGEDQNSLCLFDNVDVILWSCKISFYDTKYDRPSQVCVDSYWLGSTRLNPSL